ncbi:protein HESO1-like [Miscanthus floridulus]|uniref:protein HESO1-like n=1 Tax=Miscanthus floridulus TaxID=154761 RepID=UPI003458A3C8
MATLAASSSVSDDTDSDSDSSQCSEASTWDSQVLSRHAECLELEELTAISVNPCLLPALNQLLLEAYAILRPKPLDYDQRNTLVDVFREMVNRRFGSNSGSPVVEPFGSFTMDLFTPHSDLDLSINFSANTDERYTRKQMISIIRKFSKVLYSHQRSGIFCGVLPIVSARVPILKAIDCGTGIECDISVENKDGMTRSMIIKFVSSLDERFQILSYLVKFWAKVHDLNSPRQLTMSSMSIISLVAFHLQTRHPPILPAFSDLLKDGLDCTSVERNALLFKGFGSKNKESVAELFVSLISKLLSAESLWEHGLCASNFEASWISKTWKKGAGNLSVEDFLDRSQNFARSVGKVQMQKIFKCLRECALNLLDFMRGKMDSMKLRTLLFGRLSPDELVSKPRLEHVKRKRKWGLTPQGRCVFQKSAQHGGSATSSDSLPTANKVLPHALHYRVAGQQSSIHQFVPIIRWPRIIPSGFGYGLSRGIPSVAPHLGKGILGKPPSNILKSMELNSTSAHTAKRSASADSTPAYMSAVM